MGIAERRAEIMRVLCRRRHVTISDLAEEFGVSARTILRDIEALSIAEPIYTQCGRYGGGVFVIDDYMMSRMYMTEAELSVLQKVASFAENKSACILNKDERHVLRKIISQYTKSNLRKEKKYETTGKGVV